MAVTREQVFAACDALSSEGHPISIKTVWPRTRGQHSRILEWIQEWRRVNGECRMTKEGSDNSQFALRNSPFIIPHSSEHEAELLGRELRYITVLLESIACSLYQGMLSREDFLENLRRYADRDTPLHAG